MRKSLIATDSDVNEIESKAIQKVLAAFNKKISHEISVIAEIQEAFAPSSQKQEPEAILSEILRNLLVHHVDQLWQEHLLNIDHLRTEVHLRAIGQKDPLLEFKHEAFTLFDSLSLRIKEEISLALFKFEMMRPADAAARRPKPAPKPTITPYRTSLAMMPEIELTPSNVITLDAET